MIKRSLLIVAGVILLGAFVCGTGLFSYLAVSADRIHHSIKSNVPVEFEIQRARKMITNLTPEIRRNMELIAREEVDVERLAKRIKDSEKRLTNDRDNIMQMKADLDAGGSTFRYAGHSYTSTQVKTDLANRFERFKTNDTTLDKLHKVLYAREKSLEAARAKLDGMLAARRQLEVDVENLEARLKMVEVAQTTSDFNFDDSRLSRTKNLITDIQTRIEVAEKLVNADSNFHYEIPMDAPAQEQNVTEKITEYFGMGEASDEEVADATPLKLVE